MKVVDPDLKRPPKRKVTDDPTTGLTEYQLKEYTKYKVELILKVRRFSTLKLAHLTNLWHRLVCAGE